MRSRRCAAQPGSLRAASGRSRSEARGSRIARAARRSSPSGSTSGRAEPFRRQLDGPPRAWIFTSATLAVRGDFSHYRHELGLEEADSGSWESPFDYATSALLYLPPALPLPNSQ
jgi:hypothetical protein